jgi:uncharacterized cupin superfamily protein
MERVDEVNLYADDWDREQVREGYRWRVARVGERVGGRRIGASLYELEPGQHSFPYHFHYGNEEWLLVVSGRPTLRTPDSERELTEGDVVCFPAGPGGAHSFENRTDERARVLVLSTLVTPSISIYPDSGKLGVRPGVPEDTLNFLRPDAVDYWEGE